MKIHVKGLITFLFLAVLLSCTTFPIENITGALTTTSRNASGDYLDEGIKICGIRTFKWMGTLYTVPFYPSEIITPPSADTKNEGQVRPIVQVKDSEEKEFWTPYVLDTRPVDKEALTVGMFILVDGGTDQRSEESLKKAVWSLRRIKDLSNLYKNTVTVEYYDSYWSSWKTDEVHYKNIRMIDGEISADL